MKTQTKPIVLLLFICALIGLSSSCKENIPCAFSEDCRIRSQAFVLRYLDQIDEIVLLSEETVSIDNYRYPRVAFQFGDYNSDVLYSLNNPLRIPVLFTNAGSGDRTNYSFSSIPQEYSIPIGQYDTMSEKLGDTNFKQVVNPNTYRLAHWTGRVVIKDQIASIAIFSDKSYRSKAAGEDISEYFSIIYTDPVSMVNMEFSPEKAGTHYQFLEYIPGPCQFGRTNPFPYNEKLKAYETGLQAPYHLYWGEYIPLEIETPLKSMDFSRVPYISSIIMLEPIEFPDTPEHHVFTFKVSLTNGKVLEATMPFSMFLAGSGL